MRQMRLVSILGGRGSAVMCGWLAISGLLWLAAAGLVQRGLSIEYRDLTATRREVCVACGHDVIRQEGRLICRLFGLDIYRQGQLEYMFKPVEVHRVYVSSRQVVRAGASDCQHWDTEIASFPFGGPWGRWPDEMPPRIVRWFYCSLLLAAAALLSWVCACAIPCYRCLRTRASPRRSTRRWWLANAACAGVVALCLVVAPGSLLGGTLSRHLRRTEATAQAVGNGKQVSARRIERLLYADVPVSERHEREMLGYRRQSLALALARSDRPADSLMACRYFYGQDSGPRAVTPEVLNALHGRFVDAMLGVREGRFIPIAVPRPVSPAEAAGIESVQTNRLGEVTVEWQWGSCFTQFVRRRVGADEVMLPCYHVMYYRSIRRSERVRRFAEGPGASH